MKYPATAMNLATAASIALAGWTWMGATTEAHAGFWSSVRSAFTARPAYNTPPQIVGGRLYFLSPEQARYYGAYQDARRTNRLGTTSCCHRPFNK